ncbi:MAG: hypothetical protein L6R41_008522, partial [Letrouitia leprolyta]
MPSPQPGQALPPMRSNELIEYVLQRHKRPTTIIVCSSREEFVQNLQRSLETASADEGPIDIQINELHPLLIPTIHQIATSTTVEVAFTPTLPHLRAYLAPYKPGKSSNSGSHTFVRPGSHTSMLAIYGFLALHRDTTEYSIQGLSRSLAIAAEAADSFNMQLILTEDAEASGLQALEPGVEGETVSTQD